MFLKKVTKSIKGRYKTFRVKKRAKLKKEFQKNTDLGKPKSIIWIFGCQRSGTTFLENIFRQDFNSAVFGEFSVLTIDARKTVLSDSATIFDIVQSQNAKYAVIRPLFESDRATELLNLFPNSIGVWMFRDCPHVVDSMIRKWNDQFFAISKKVESDQYGNWRLERNIQPIMKQISKMPLSEVYARYWISRNQIPLVNKLDQDDRILFLNYSHLAKHPKSSVEQILQSASIPGLWKNFNARAKVTSIDRPIQHQISVDTQHKTNEIYDQLLALNHRDFS